MSENVILLAIDGSTGAERALAHTRRRAELGGAKVVVAYVIEWSPYSFNTPEENAERHSRRESEIAKAHDSVIGPALSYLTDGGIVVDSIVRHGNPTETLIAVAKETSAAQIVIGRRGQSGLKSLIFGSVAGNLIQTAPVPVMVVP
ncbi:universal stress protein [Parasedimentitalea maritima]|uniref:Universal stress protein n=1 Tax=Parasedimentitalea maritima TaxID=2578117 RepID=A0A5R8ZIX4_9RHOB|nr:universal stress protein [Zongyanglinia marina]KAE9630931.1 universal stress protein [Zongyanglinia marina]TLP65713.1 universal stress protein [Zongyanglinia marina]